MRWLSRRNFLIAAGCLFAGQFGGWTRMAVGRSKKSGFQPVRFGALSDSHINVQGVDNWLMGESSSDCLSATVCALNALGLDFVLISGDLLHQNVPENLVQAKNILDTLTPPYFVVAGNHDYSTTSRGRQHLSSNTDCITNFIQTFQGHGYDTSGRRYWAAQVGERLRLIGLDGCLCGQSVEYGGYLPEGQLDWLNDQLAGHRDDLHVIMVHHNLVYWGNDHLSKRGRWFSLDNSSEVRQILEAHNANVYVVISGHRHIGLRARRLNDIDYLTLPSINSYPMRYTIFDLNRNELKWKTIPVPIEPQLHRKAKSNLINADWIESLNKMDLDQILRFYENNIQTTGRFVL